MAYMIVHGYCCACQTFISFNPDYVPSLRVNGTKEPLCRGCYAHWNEMHRTSKGLEPIPLHPDAYQPLETL